MFMEAQFPGRKIGNLMGSRQVLSMIRKITYLSEMAKTVWLLWGPENKLIPRRYNCS